MTSVQAEELNRKLASRVRDERIPGSPLFDSSDSSKPDKNGREKSCSSIRWLTTERCCAD